MRTPGALFGKSDIFLPNRPALFHNSEYGCCPTGRQLTKRRIHEGERRQKPSARSGRDEALGIAEYRNGRPFRKVGMDLGLAPRLFGLGATAAWHWPVENGVFQRQFHPTASCSHRERARRLRRQAVRGGVASMRSCSRRRWRLRAGATRYRSFRGSLRNALARSSMIRSAMVTRACRYLSSSIE